MTSDALCRATALAQELHTPAFADRPPASPCGKAHKRSPPRQGTQYSCLFKAAIHPAQDAFDRIDAQSCDWAEIVTRTLFVFAPDLRTLSSFASLPSLSGKSRRAALPCALLARLAAYLDDTGKMLLTDLCNRHSDTSTHKSPDSRARGLRRESASVMSPKREPCAIRSAASDHLAAI